LLGPGRRGAPNRVERIPICVDCLRRQRLGLFGVCGVAVACLIAALFVYSRNENPSGAQLAQLPPRHDAAAAPAPTTPEPSSLFVSAPVAPAPARTDAAPAPSPVAASIPAPPLPPAATPDVARANSASYTEPGATAPPVWGPDHKPAPRKPPAPRHPALSSVLALRNNGYNQLLQRRYAEAISLFQQATAMGDAYAPMYIGQIFENGLGVARSVGQASYWYGVAINRGNAAALAAFNRLRLNPY
jgi:hypothetical protein